jgi:hypothetical protein
MAGLGVLLTGVLVSMAVGLAHSQTTITPLTAKGINFPEPSHSPVPQWYEDVNGLKLTLCMYDGAACPAPPDTFKPSDPLAFPANWPDETFYYMAAATGTLPGHGEFSWESAVEHAFAGPSGAAAAGQQLIFTRLRFRMKDAPAENTYVIEHPYGKLELTADIKGVDYTDDIGAADRLNYCVAMNGNLGPFLRAADEPGGTPPLDPVTIGDQNFLTNGDLTFITGAPSGHDFVRVCRKGTPDTCVEINQFTLLGQIAQESLADESQTCAFAAPGPPGPATITPLTAKGINFPEPSHSPVPQWYEDVNGLKLTLCMYDGAACPAPPDTFKPSDPLAFPANWPDETFYYMAAATGTLPGHGEFSWESAVEHAFAGPSGAAAAGQQLIFTRLRFRMKDAPAENTYVIEHPYGKLELTADIKGVDYTDDIGAADRLNYCVAMNGNLGPFLRAADEPGGTPPLDPVTIGDQNFLTNGDLTFITGAPSGHDFVRVCRKGTPDTCVEINQFTLLGQIAQESSADESPTCAFAANYVCGPEVSGFILHVAPLLLVNSSIRLFYNTGLPSTAPSSGGRDGQAALRHHNAS